MTAPTRPLPALLALALGLSLAACAGGTAHARPARDAGKAAPAVDDAHRVRLTSRAIEISGGIGDGMIAKAQQQLLELDAQSHDPVWILINSGGGSVEAGLVLIDTMRGVKSPIHCLVESKAYSMAAIILTFCERRYALDHATIMLHEASYGTAGEDPSNRSRLDFLTRYLDLLHAEIAGRLGMKVEAYRARIRDAWWLMAEEAEKAGVIHGVVREIAFDDRPVERTEGKTTTTIQRVRQVVPEGMELPRIPKRRD